MTELPHTNTRAAYEVGVFSTGNLSATVGATPNQRLRGLAEIAQRAEGAGFDIFAVGEAHRPPAVISSPLVLLAHVAALTKRIGLSTAASLITVNDPVKLAEDFSTLQHLSGGRAGLMIGRGIDASIYAWYGLDPDQTLAITVEKYELLRRIWAETNLSWQGEYRAPLDNFSLTPKPLTPTIPNVWHTSIRTKELVEMTARLGEGFFANYVHFTAEQAAPHVHYFRERYEAHGHGAAANAPVGSGAKVFVKPNSQDARRLFEEQGSFDWARGGYSSLDDAIARSALTVGSPQQVLDKIAHFQEQYGGYSRQLFSIDQPGGTVDSILDQIDLIGEHILPALRNTYGTRSASPAVAPVLLQRKTS